MFFGNNRNKGYPCAATMNELINRRIVLASRPVKAATLDCFRLETRPVGDLQDGELLLRTVWLSLDPYMRGRMSDAPSYAAPVAIGDVMTAETVARVERSSHPNFREGDWVLARAAGRSMRSPRAAASSSCRRYRIAVARTRRLGHARLHRLRRIARHRQAEAAGDGGRRRSNRRGRLDGRTDRKTQGLPGRRRRRRRRNAPGRSSLGFDACVDHRSSASVKLAAACPQGVDVYYENVGGKVFRAVLPLINAHARIPVCGLISQYNEAPAATEASRCPD